MLALSLGVVVAAGCDDDAATQPASTAADGSLEWPAPPDPIERTQAAGLQAERREQLQTHRHSHLDVFVDGEPVTVPAGLGIDITDPGVREFDGPAYGGIEECTEPCISPLHTHDETGIIHTESASDELRTLGQLFVEWNVRLDNDCVADYCAPETDITVYLDGEEYEGDPADIPLENGLEIAIVVGAPPARIPDSANMSNA